MIATLGKLWSGDADFGGLWHIQQYNTVQSQSLWSPLKSLGVQKSSCISVNV
jgi:hypothetical protein